MARQAAARAGNERRSSRDATALASGPVAPSGPTHDGHPDSHGQLSMSSRVAREQRPRACENSGSLKPMPPG